ncbi:MAG: hypothetical protein JWP32_3000 [Schumannella sp.]|nr:hypothetical protein [Schumannella sp.]
MMKKLLILTLSLAGFSFAASAQCPANDSTIMGAGTANDVFYSLTNHTVATASNTNWHLAFSVQASRFPTNPANGVAIRVNSGLKASGGTTLVKLKNANPANWRSIDTTDLHLLPQLLDSDSTWDFSAFTSGYSLSDPFNFIWGTYNQTTHNVTGSSVFVLYNKTAGWYKKIFVNECTGDAAWDFIISNIDNSDSSNIKFSKSTYANKLFAYYNVLTNQMIDREPVKTSWDLLWTKYITYVTSQMGNAYYPVTGVLSNPAVTVEQNNGKTCSNVWLNNRTSKVDPRINAIGYDWKSFNGMAYIVTDTFVYFVKGQNGKTYKMTFNQYSGSALGKSTFNFYEATTGINSVDAQSAFSVYPNPNNGMISLASDLDITSVQLTDMQGKTVYTGANAGAVDISSLSNGVYIMSIHTAEGTFHQQVIKQ